MAKIGKEYIGINKEGIHKSFNVDVEYTRSNGFFIVIPVELQSKAEILKDNYSSIVRSKVEVFIVQGKNEMDCINNAKLEFFNLLKSTIKERAVIIVLYEPDNNCTFGEHQYNKEHTQIGLRMGLTYAIEVESLGKLSYFLQEGMLTGDGLSPSFRYKSGTNLRIWERGSTIIDDTPDNRLFLETLYLNLKVLNDKLGTFTKTPESMQNFIESKVKLIETEH